MTDLSERIKNLTPEKRALLEARLLREKAAAQPLPAIPRRGGSGPAPLSFAQQRLWFLDQLDPGSAYYNLPVALRLLGELDVPALGRALDAVVARHEALRTTFPTRNGEPYQAIGPARGVALERRDLSGETEGERPKKLRRALAEELGRPFDLSRDSMLRATLYRELDRSHVLLLLMHHIAADGWSVGLLLQELSAFYAAYRSGSEPSVPSLPIQYADYAVWQREWLAGGVEASQLEYWKKRLAGELPLLALPTDRSRPSQQTYAGAQERRFLPHALAEKLEALSRREGATLFMTFLAAFQVFLARLSGQEDILVGTPIAGRNRVEIENLIGFFVNTLVVRGDLSGNPTFRELLARIRERSIEAYAHQDLPFERLVEELHPERDLAHSPLFQVMFSFENYPLPPPEMTGLTAENVEIDTLVSNFDLTLDIALQEKGVSVSMEFNTDLFDRQTIRRWTENFEVLLEGVAADPDRRLWDLPLLTPAERERLLVSWNATTAPFPEEKCLHELFEARAATDPHGVALEDERGAVTYGDLERAANSLAVRLREQGVGPEVPVGICLGRSREMAAALLGILKAGGAYVPLDPAYPAARLRLFLEDSGAAVLLSESRLAPSVGEGAWKTILIDVMPDEAGGEPARPAGGATPDNLAYILYTSGSTGRPKGVMVSHRALVNHATAVARRFGLTPSDRVLQFASISFDVAAEEIFPTWAAGASLVLRPGESVGVPEFESLLESRGVTVVNLPSGFWHEWVSELEASGRKPPSSVRLVVAGSERVLPERLEWWRRNVPTVRWMNGYGPTESTVTATLYEPSSGDPPRTASVPIGRPIANVRAYVVDPAGGLCPTGAHGELWIGGEGLARGYRGLPEQTAEKFVADPFASERGRLYRTGDSVRYLPDGNLEFLGRLDEQVKIRGFRIEPAEIETVLAEHPAVREAVVVALENDGETRLAAYVVFDEAHRSSAGDLRAHLKARLPVYMVPSVFVPLESMPRTPSGKADRQRLPEPGRSRQTGERFLAPRTPLEQAVAVIWADLLRVDRIGASDNFFDLGGHSLLATRVISRLRETFGLELPLRVLFETPTVEELALAIAQIQAAQASPDELARLLEELEKEAPATQTPTRRS